MHTYARTLAPEVTAQTSITALFLFKEKTQLLLIYRIDTGFKLG